jgi:hypothetical protein
LVYYAIRNAQTNLKEQDLIAIVNVRVVRDGVMMVYFADWHNTGEEEVTLGNSEIR